MAKIHEEIVVIKLSKLVKDGSPEQGRIATEELVESLAAVAEELGGAGVVVIVIIISRFPRVFLFRLRVLRF